MPYPFSRPWLNLERIFRPSGEFTFPNQLSERVSIVYDALSRMFTQGAVLQSTRLTKALGAGANSQLLPEPSAGVIQYPVSLLAGNPDAASRLMALAIITTSSNPDPWGRYSTASTQIDIGTVAAADYLRARAIPVPRGNQLQVNWVAMTGGNSAFVDYLWIEVPGELMILDDMAHRS